MKNTITILFLTLAVIGCATPTSAPVRGKGVVVSYSTKPNVAADAARGSAVGGATGAVGVAAAYGPLALTGPVGLAVVATTAATGAITSAFSGDCGDGMGYLTFVDASGQLQEVEHPRRSACKCEPGDEIEYLQVGYDKQIKHYLKLKDLCTKKASTDKNAS